MNQSKFPLHQRLLREPFLHFLLLGALLFALNAWREARRPKQVNSAGIAVTEAVLERLCAGYQRQFNRTPDEEELRGLVTAHIREEVLSREALALGLDRDDTIVRRRLAQKMEFLTDDITSAVEPAESALQQFFATNRMRYARPARVSFRQVYFSKEKRGARGEAMARAALTVLRQGANDEALGDAFLHGFEFSDREPDEVAALFGHEFAKQLEGSPVGAWSGPMASSYGLHIVRIESRSEPPATQLNDVRMAVVRDFNDERRRAANQDIFDRLKQRYHITVDAAALSKIAQPALRTAQVTP